MGTSEKGDYVKPGFCTGHPHSGNGGRPGELQCNLGVTVGIEASAPCDGLDPLIGVGSACFAVTTAVVTDLLTNANFSSGQLPIDGAAVNEGLPVACSAIRGGSLGGLETRGAVSFFGTALGTSSRSGSRSASEVRRGGRAPHPPRQRSPPPFMK